MAAYWVQAAGLVTIRLFNPKVKVFKHGLDYVPLTEQHGRVVYYAATAEDAHLVGYQITEKDGKNVLENLSGKLHTVSIGDVGRACSCSFHQTLHMPCRHIFATQIYQELHEFEIAMVAKRWQKLYQLLVDETDGALDSYTSDLHAEQPEVQVSSIASGVNLTGTLTQNQKYRKIQTLCQKLALITTQNGQVQKYAEIQSIIRCWEYNTPIVITPVTDTGKVS